MQPGSIGFAALSNVDAIELRIAPSQAPTPAALCRVERLRSGEAVNASGGEVTRNGEDVVGGCVHREKTLG
jgi:hypothetical protein